MGACCGLPAPPPARRRSWPIDQTAIQHPYTVHSLRLDLVRPRYALAVLAVLWAVYLGALWPWMMRWGATDAALMLLAAALRRRPAMRPA